MSIPYEVLAVNHIEGAEWFREKVAAIWGRESPTNDNDYPAFSAETDTLISQLPGKSVAYAMDMCDALTAMAQVYATLATIPTAERTDDRD